MTPHRLCTLTLIVWVVALPAAAQESTEAGPAAPQTPTGGEQASFLRRTFATLVEDVKRLPNRDSLGIALLGSAQALLVLPVDRTITQSAASSKALKAAFGTTAKLLGEEYVQGGSALTAYLVGRLLDKPQMTRVGGDLIEAQALSAMLTQTLKFAVRRTRPDGELRSFPSGHASASFATASVLHRHFGLRGAIPAYGTAVYITVSRLQANSHYASDVLIGAALGMIVGRTATLDLAGKRLELTPVALPGGAGFSVNLR